MKQGGLGLGILAAKRVKPMRAAGWAGAVLT